MAGYWVLSKSPNLAAEERHMRGSSYIVGHAFEEYQEREPTRRAFDLTFSSYVLGEKRNQHIKLYGIGKEAR